MLATCERCGDTGEVRTATIPASLTTPAEDVYDECPRCGWWRSALERYRDHRIPTGDFLRSVLVNDLRQAIMRADHRSLLALPEIVRYVNDLPTDSWGDNWAVNRWLENGPVN